ncbi:hypothetical protein BaRGS_00029671 [Batillaria attramentaria]|uniref:Uncharacterized protein n=1 Tax=Batillaria attramentaria TaxID=370345 RepID=A0ABD0JWG3_9CAEN
MVLLNNGPDFLRKCVTESAKLKNGLSSWHLAESMDGCSRQRVYRHPSCVGKAAYGDTLRHGPQPNSAHKDFERRVSGTGSQQQWYFRNTLIQDDYSLERMGVVNDSIIEVRPAAVSSLSAPSASADASAAVGATSSYTFSH